MKTYSELSEGKWIVTDDEVLNQNNQFILIPYIKGKISTNILPTLTCDCDSVITSWNGKGFIVTLPSSNTTHNFTLIWGDLVRTFKFIVSEHLLEDIDSLKSELQSTQSKLEIMRNLLLGNQDVNFFQLTCESPGVYYYGVNPAFEIPPELPVSINYAIISGGVPTPIPSRCPFVWVDSRGNEVIRNFYCVVDGSRLLIINQDNETFMKDNLLMYTTTGTYDAGVCGIVSVQPGFDPVRLQGEGFIGLQVTAKIGGSYVHSELIPVCVSGNRHYEPVGGTVNDLGNKIVESGFPQTMINLND